MSIDEQYKAEWCYIRRRLPVRKWVGDLKRRGFPPYGWVKVGRHEYRGGVRPICSACGYLSLRHAVVITHPAKKVTIVVGPYCAENATG